MGGKTIPISDRAATVKRQNKVSLTDWDKGVPSSATVAFDLLRDALSAIFGLSELKSCQLILPLPIFCHSEARSWSIPSEDPYEEAARQLLEQAPRSPEYVPEDHVPVYIPEPEHLRVQSFDTTTSRCPERILCSLRAEIAVLRREDLLSSKEGYGGLLLETEARRHEWQRQAVDDLAVQHIMRTQALEAGARVDTLEDTR
ncbi:hypothetical protein Tco_0266005 [Tanacetum coccineum]